MAAAKEGAVPSAPSHSTTCSSSSPPPSPTPSTTATRNGKKEEWERQGPRRYTSRRKRTRSRPQRPQHGGETVVGGAKAITAAAYPDDRSSSTGSSFSLSPFAAAELFLPNNLLSPMEPLPLPSPSSSSVFWSSRRAPSPSVRPSSTSAESDAPPKGTMAIDAERRRFHQWAIAEAEVERQRRIMELARLDEEEQGERLKRRQWALHAVEEEQRRMIAEEFLLAFANRKQWYSDTLSSFCEDYQIMCPNSSLGCTTSCLRKDLDRHLSLECRFGPGAPEATNSEGMDESTLHYEVVCPYAVMGCLVVCPRRDIAKHLARCPFSGPRREEEKEERTRCLNMVLEAMEEERARRVQLEASGDWRSDQASCRSRAFLNTLFERQTRRGLGLLSEELSDFVAQCHADEVKRGPALEEAMTSIASVVQRLWPSACVLPYGSVASGLMTAESDIDLVVCPGEENSPYLRVDQLGTTLSESLPQFTVLKVLQHARIPIIKARWAAPDGQVFRMDLSLEVPGHTGLATTAFVTYLVDHMPRLKPLVLVLKHLLQYHNLSDPYKGGLSSYALTIMAAYLLLGGGAKVGGCPRPRPSPRRPPPQVPRPHGWQRQWDRANQQQWLGARTARAILMQDAFAQALPILLSQPHLQQADGNDCLNVESSKNILSSTEEGDEKDEGGSEPYPSTPSYASLATHAGTEREKPLGDLFIDFLRLFGTDFDVENEGFSIRGGGFRFCLRPQNATPHPCMGDPIVIEDPLDPTNNPGRCSFAISRVQQCFSEVLTTIMEGMVRLDVERQEGREKKLMNSGLLHRVISGPSAY